jgi:hypothetical protein
VNKTYDKLSYFDVYGGSVFFCIVLIVAIVFFFYHAKIRMAIVPIRNNWSKYRCNPLVMPFAAYIVEPKDVPWLKFTGNNFSFCANNILTNIVGYFMLPIQFILVPLLFMWKIILKVMQAIRKMIYYIRTQMTKITANIMNRVFGVMIQVQKMVISIRDLFAKVRGAMVAALYTLFGTYFAIKSALGAIMNLCIIILVALAAMIIIFWTMPWTWGVAAALTAIFVMLSIPVIYIIVFMDQILKTQPNQSMPGKPGRPRGCFDGDTLIEIRSISTGEKIAKPIKQVQVGDALYKGGVVTAVMKVLLEHSDIGKIDNITVTGDHYVFHDNKWIHSREHPEYVPIVDYKEQYVYCLNVSTKVMQIKNTVFSDWDDMVKIDEVYHYNKKYADILQENDESEVHLHRPENIHRCFDGGLVGETPVSTINGIKLISDIRPGEQLDLGNMVIAIVEVDARDLDQYVHYLTKSSSTGNYICLRGTNNIIYSNGISISNNPRKGKRSTITDYAKKNRLEYNRTTLYHLVTTTGNFKVGQETTVYDYNSCLDFFE